MEKDEMCGKPIGVFDSGVGGLTVLAAAVKLLPNESFLYYGDTAHAPYGSRSAEDVRHLSLVAATHLYELGCKALVVACNTATGAAVATLRESLPIPIIGMEPALKPALERGGKILVMATPLTLMEEKFKRLCTSCGAGQHNAVVLPCPGLVEMVERGQTRGSEVERVLVELLAGVDLDGVTAVVLGCTHYLFIRTALSCLLPPGTVFIDGNYGTTRQLERVLKQKGLLCGGQVPGTITFLSSGGNDAIGGFKKFYQNALAEMEGLE